MTRKIDGEKEGKDRGTRRAKSEVPTDVDTDSLGQAGQVSRADAGEPERGDGEALTTVNTQWREACLGKILSQLRELREAHLAYVNAHTDRLRVRLAEDEEHRSQIMTGLDELEQEIILQMEKVKASNVKPTVDASDEEG